MVRRDELSDIGQVSAGPKDTGGLSWEEYGDRPTQVIGEEWSKVGQLIVRDCLIRRIVYFLFEVLTVSITIRESQIRTTGCLLCGVTGLEVKVLF